MEQSKLKVEGCFCFDFQPMGEFDLFVTGRSHFLLSERLLSFNNVIITLTSARWGARIVELASGIYVTCFLRTVLIIFLFDCITVVFLITSGLPNVKNVPYEP